VRCYCFVGMCEVLLFCGNVSGVIVLWECVMCHCLWECVRCQCFTEMCEVSVLWECVRWWCFVGMCEVSLFYGNV
jgi:hypothetical protein